MFEYNITTSLTYHYCFIEVPVSREKSDWSCACVLRIHNKENYDEHHRLTKKPRENPYLCQYSLLVVFHVMLENLVGQGNHACSNSNACYDFCIKTMFGSS
jgi:hypothetical protein